MTDTVQFDIKKTANYYLTLFFQQSKWNEETNWQKETSL